MQSNTNNIIARTVDFVFVYNCYMFRPDGNIKSFMEYLPL